MGRTVLMIVLQLAASGTDAYYTNKNLENRGGENNPLVQPFMGSRPDRIAYFSVSTGIKIGLPLVLRRKHHNKLARLAEVLSISDNAIGALESARNQ
jgi:hypothetical protein